MEALTLTLDADVVENFMQIPDMAGPIRAVLDGKEFIIALVLAGSRKADQDFLAAPRPLGTLIAAGILRPTQTFQFHPLTSIDLGICIIGTLVGTGADLLEAVGFVEEGLAKPTVSLMELEDLPQVSHEMEAGKARPIHIDKTRKSSGSVTPNYKFQAKLF
jgi:alcohol dehydrogenase, propanol-preferring